MLRLAPEDMLIATVGRRRLLVELLLVECQRFIGDVVVRIRTTAVTALGEYIKHVPVTEADAVLE